MSAAQIPPGLVLILGALLLPLLSGRARAVLVGGLPGVCLVAVWTLPGGAAWTMSFMDYTLMPVTSTAAGRLFATVFAIMAAGGGLYALNRMRTHELAAAYVYAGAAIGVTFAGDLLTLFIFWEIMALASAALIWSAASPAAYRAGLRYAMVHLGGGVVLMTGILAHAIATGSIAVGPIALESSGAWLILAGFLVNAGAPPLSAWIPDAYPEASPGGTVFLSAFTTKTAVYALLVTFAGAQILIWIGLYMAVYGIVYALLENDMRRILAYSIVNQVGFMVCGIGIGTDLALNGTAAHAFAHIIYKALLLMSAGSVLYMTGKRKCTELGGLFQSMPVTTVCGIVGALSISAFPLTSGFISKSMISAGAANEHLAAVWFVLTAASAGVFLHAGIKFPWFVFFQKDSGLRPPDPPATMRLAMWIFAGLCIGLGVYPQALYALLPFPAAYWPYTPGHVLSQLQLLLFAGLAFFLMLAQMQRTRTLSLDWDWFYRDAGPRLARALVASTAAARQRLEARTRARLARLVVGLTRHHGPQGVLARTWPTGSMVLWVAILLGAYLIFYYL